ncbi:hypothetical protein D5S17_33225 [Pseudonocardiaceae bacterium YIM PH 21723]|nr:hypothetical protein D5S17_33225 [Pseudonocardiaceae bacterium YIM PH 21723]
MALKELPGVPNQNLLFGKAALTSFFRSGDTLPETEYVLKDLAIDGAKLAEYNKVCGFGLRDALPATYIHTLAGPVHLQLMTDPGFPFAATGLVHIRNQITQHRPVTTGEKLTITVKLADLRAHDKGTQFDVVASASVGGETVWDGVSTILKRGKSTTSSEGGAKAPKEAAAPQEPNAVWPLPGDLGWSYAGVSGDYNPIHLNPITAKLFGFPRNIAHGMWSKARCLAAFEGRLPEKFTVDVSFKLPILLPAKVAFTSTEAAGGFDFALTDARKGKPHLAGTIR